MTALLPVVHAVLGFISATPHMSANQAYPQILKAQHAIKSQSLPCCVASLINFAGLITNIDLTI